MRNDEIHVMIYDLLSVSYMMRWYIPCTVHCCSCRIVVHFRFLQVTVQDDAQMTAVASAGFAAEDDDPDASSFSRLSPRLPVSIGKS